MKTIGILLKEGRLKKNYSLERVEEETKIKKEFIRAIEKENWKALPEYAVVLGFVKNIANFIGLDSKEALALLRRDYPPNKNIQINPKPDLKESFKWGPKLTFLLGTAAVSLLVVSYLVFQYVKFKSPPSLQVYEPVDNAIIKTTDLKVTGKVDPEASLKINNQPVIVENDGSFTGDIEISKDTYEIEIKAISRSGKETKIYRKIKPELN
jgi:hypothetical protein